MKPFQRAFALSILPLKVDHDRWASIDQFYQIHLARARCAYIRHVWNSSDKDYKPHADCYLHDLVEYLPAVESLLLVPDNIGVTLAYDLFFYLTGYLHIKADSVKQSAAADEVLAVIDVMLLRVIDRRLRAPDGSDTHNWIPISLSRFSQASERLTRNGLPNYLVASISRLNEENDKRNGLRESDGKDEEGLG